jgi:COMPASS component SPP1
LQASSSSAAPVTQAVQSIASTQRYKYKYPEAYPTPDGEDDEVWNKLFTAADSRLYNKHGKNANESKKYRASGATRELALKMLQEKKEKLATETAGGMFSLSSTQPMDYLFAPLPLSKAIGKSASGKTPFGNYII